MNVSANNEAMLLKLDRDVAPYKIYQVVYILMLLWQHAWFQSASSKFNICGCTGRKIQLKMLKRRLNKGGLALCLRNDQVFCLVESQMVILNFEEAGDWNRAFCHSNIKMYTTCKFCKVHN